MQDRARVVIVGGGVHGTSLAYHLTKEGWTDVLLIEKAELTSGSTWHAAGQITRSVADYTTAAFHHYAIELYERLEAETGQGISFHQPGGLRVAYTDLEVDALRAQLGVGRYVGYPIELIGPSDAATINPFYDFAEAKAAIWTEGEGHVDPSGVTMAFAAGARAAGATISRRNRVEAISPLPTGEWEVTTEHGVVTCEHVVDAAGCYAAQVGAFTGLVVPQANVLHHYLVTEEIPEFAASDQEMPVMRDNRVAGYIRQEQTAGLIGIYEHRGAESIWDDGVPWEAENPLFPADYDKIAPWLTEAFERVPVLSDAGIKRAIHGAITHTIDSHMLLGPAPGLRNFWLNTGSSIGLAWGPCAGRELARWIVHGTTELNLRPYDPRRFAWVDGPETVEHVRRKALEDYEWMFRVHPPGEERLAHRPIWTSSLHEKLRAKRAMHGQTYAWEQPKWFVPGDRPLADAHGWRRPGWYGAVAEECRGVRQRVGILDLSAFSKMDVLGPDAHPFLDYLTTGVVSKTPGRIGLNYVLTEQGRIETEITATKLLPDPTSDDSNDRYFVVSGPLGHRRDQDHFAKYAADYDVTIIDKTRQLGTLLVAGPRSRDLLSRCTDADVSNKGFPFLTGRELVIGGVTVRAMRVGFTGGLSWELHVPMTDLPEVYDHLMAEGTDLGIIDFGSHALNSLRMEKAYLTRFELTHDVGPYQAGVGRWVKPEKGNFVGRDALLASTGSGPDWKLVYLCIDVPRWTPADTPDGDTADCIGGEGVFDGERPVGLTTSGGYGFTVEQSLAFAYVDRSVAIPGTSLDVLLLGERRPAVVLDGPVNAGGPNE